MEAVGREVSMDIDIKILLLYLWLEDVNKRYTLLKLYEQFIISCIDIFHTI